MTLAVEIERNDSHAENHHHARKEKQRIAFQGNLTFERTRVIVLKPDSGKYALVFTDPMKLEYWTSKPLTADASASAFWSAVEGYYSEYCGSGIKVTKTMLNSSAMVTNVTSEAVVAYYDIELTRLINRESILEINPVPAQTGAEIAVIPPSQI